VCPELDNTLSVLMAIFQVNLVFIRAPFYLLLVFIKCVLSVFWLF